MADLLTTLGLVLASIAALALIRRHDPYIIRISPRRVERLLDSAWIVRTLKGGR